MTSKGPQPEANGLSQAKRDLLAKRLKGKATGMSEPKRITPRPDGGPGPLSFAQQRFWFLDQLEPGNPAYHISVAVKLLGQLDIDSLKRSLEAIVSRHASLRTVFTSEHEEPRQVVRADLPLDWLVDQGPGESAPPQPLEPWIQRWAGEPFDLRQGPLMRVRLLRMSEQEHVLLFVIHHIVADGWSIGILLGELGEFYKSFVAGQPLVLNDLPIQYADYACWQRDEHSQRFDKQLEYWKKQLADAPPAVELTTDRPRPSVQTYQGARESLILPKQLKTKLEQLSHQSGATLFMTLAAAFQTLLHRYSQQDDITIGTAIAGRTTAQTEGLIGLFVNSLALRNNLSDDPRFEQVLQHVCETALAGYANQDLPFDLLVERLRPARDQGRTPFFQIMFALQNVPMSRLELGDLTLIPLATDPGTVAFDLELRLFEEPDGLRCVAAYNTDLFDAETIQRMLAHYEQVLEAVVVDPGLRLSQVPMLSQAESVQFDRWNDTTAEYPGTVSIAQIFEARVVEDPDTVALIHDDRRVTYTQLNRRANQLAHRLQKAGVGPDTTVAVLMDRGVDVITAILGILKAGGAYVPLDPSYPAQRLRWIVSDSHASLLITQAASLPLIDVDGVQVLCLDRDAATLDGEPTENPTPCAHGENLAYVIYTSGSTGLPKGVRVPHRAIARLLFAVSYLKLGRDQTFLQMAPVSFDASTLEIWGPLLHGGRLVIYPDRLPTAKQLKQTLEDHGVTAAWLTAALFNTLIDEDTGTLAGLQQLIIGGEALSVPHVCKAYEHLPRTQIINGYGPTESTTFTCCYPIPRGLPTDARSVPIGKPIGNTRVYVLDRWMNRVPVGVSGELYIGGDGLALGYHDQSGLTDERFVRSTHLNETRLYKTGDLVRWLPDGNIEFLGRNDDQVKIRGFRIEPGEVESVLAQHGCVRAAAVVVRAAEVDEKQLVAYVVPTPEAAVGDLVDRLRADLHDRLPDYMIPSAWVVLDALPLTANGKVDRLALPVPQPTERATLAAATNDAQAGVLAIWRELLSINDVGIHDNFFDLGGHSLLLVKLHRKLAERFGDRLSIVDLFRFSTVYAQAERLDPDAVSLDPTVTVQSTRSHKHAADEPVAIIGMAGRFPGAQTVEALWQNLCHGIESIRRFSDDELRKMGIDDRLLNNPNYVKADGYLDDTDRFDAGFFGYSPREATSMDPQQRLFLESAWQAIESAGYDPRRYGGAIGVFVGTGYSTYGLGFEHDLVDLVESGDSMNTLMGSASDFLATRVAYKLNLRGPAVNVQTACSTSLVATHLAVQSLQNGECDMALAGGVSIKMPEHTGFLYHEGGIHSPDGRCRPFDANANGTVRGSGAAAVLLKRLDMALADGDTIYAVIKGSAINNDGSSKIGYTAPGIDGQSQVIASALQRAGVEPNSIGYIEAHGTGTKLGDPVEVAALTRVFGQNKRDHTCTLGALKANIGHLDAAAGVTGLIKTALILKHGLIPPNPHFESPNPQIDFEHGPFSVNTRLTQWQTGDSPRRAGVSSFGIGGTNAHVILEEAPPVESSKPSRPWHLLPLSAKSPEALEQARSNLATYLKEDPQANLADVAYTLQVGRACFDHRSFAVCRDSQDAIAALEAQNSSRLATTAQTTQRPVVFLFSGQGAQYPNMGRHLYEDEPVFREQVDQCCQHLKDQHGLDLRQALLPGEAGVERAQADLTQTQLAQPALFVIEYALAKLWVFWGIQPTACLGHSIGEYVAACLAGVISLPDVLGLVTARGQLMSQMPAGSMLAVNLSEPQLRSLLPEPLNIAAINGPTLCVVSGPTDAIGAFEITLEQQGHEPRRLHTSHAFHGPMMDPVVGPFTQLLERIELKPPILPFVSNVTGDWITADQATDPTYWASHLRQTVRFSEGLKQLFATGPQILLEVGPGQTLGALANRHPDKPTDSLVLTSMRHPKDGCHDTQLLQTTLGKLWLAGAQPNWSSLHAGQKRRRVALPTYPFERKRYWIESQKSSPSGSKSTRCGMDDWFYLPSWKRSVPAAPAIASHTPFTWLLFLDSDGLGQMAADRLTQGGHTVIRVVAGNRFDRNADGSLTVDPSQRDHYEQLLAELHAKGQTPERILHLWSVTPGQCSKSAGFSQDLGFYSVLYLTQAWAQHHGEGRLDLSVVTHQVQDVTGHEMLCPEKATVLGVTQAVGMEQPQITCRCIDIEWPPSDHDRAWLCSTLVHDVLAATSDDAIAYRGRHRWVRAYDPVALVAPTSRPTRLRENGVYIITGGLGGIGLSLAEYLADRVQARLVLVSRLGLPPQDQWQDWLDQHESDDPTSSKIRHVQDLQGRGAKVLVCCGDVTDHDQMSAVLAQGQAAFGAIHGVVAAAGAEKGLWPTQDVDRATCDQQMVSKLQGLSVLSKVLENKPIDFCLLHGSLASVLGVVGGAAYTAAHHFMDAFSAQVNRTSQFPWLCVNWDNWSTWKNQSNDRVSDSFIDRQERYDALDRLFHADALTQVVVSTHDLPSSDRKPQDSRSQQDNHQDAAISSQTLHPRPQGIATYSPPRNETERQLATIWQELLGVEAIGIHDNFFELGGDSVVGIQVVARAKRAGIRLVPHQLFENQTIAELALAADPLAPVIAAEQGLVTGDVPLTPIQHWFIEKDFTDAHHFNQAALFELDHDLDPHRLQKAFCHLAEHHDVLRLRLEQDSNGWRQQIADLVDAVGWSVFDLSAHDQQQQDARIESESIQLQEALGLTRGPIIKAAYFKLGAKRPGRLLIVIHHVAIDAVCWPFLLEDLQTVYEQLTAQQSVQLPPKTTSIKQWADKLLTHANTEGVLKESAYWLGLPWDRVTALPQDHHGQDNTVAQQQQISSALTTEQTRSLLEKTSGVAGTTAHETLLGALGIAMARWSGSDTVLIDCEGHGRKSIDSETDLSRTVGWFTSLYPVLLMTTDPGGLDGQLSTLIDQVQKVPDNGFGFGLLRYMSGNESIRQELAALPKAEVCFLYQGSRDQSKFADRSFLRIADEPIGPIHSPLGTRPYQLEWIASVVDHRLRIQLRYSGKVYKQSSMDRLLQIYLDALSAAINGISGARIGACKSNEPRQPSCSDADLSQKELDGLISQITKR